MKSSCICIYTSMQFISQVLGDLVVFREYPIYVFSFSEFNLLVPTTTRHHGNFSWLRLSNLNFDGIFHLYQIKRFRNSLYSHRNVVCSFIVCKVEYVVFFMWYHFSSAMVVGSIAWKDHSTIPLGCSLVLCRFLEGVNWKWKINHPFLISFEILSQLWEFLLNFLVVWNILETILPQLLPLLLTFWLDGK